LTGTLSLALIRIFSGISDASVRGALADRIAHFLALGILMHNPLCFGKEVKLKMREIVALALDNDASPEKRWAALQSLRQSSLPPEEKARIVNLLLTDHTREIRFAAAMEAGAMGDNKTVELLREMIGTAGDEEIEKMALHSLGELLGSALIPTLVRLLQDGNTDGKLRALSVLAGMTGAPVTQVVREAFREDPSIAFETAIILAGRGDSEGVNVLLARAEGPSWVDRILAILALCRLGLPTGFERLYYLLTADHLDERERDLVIMLLRGDLKLVDKTDDEVFKYARDWVTEKVRKEMP
jgi:HEAT repeat protein